MSDAHDPPQQQDARLAGSQLAQASVASQADGSTPQGPTPGESLRAPVMPGEERPPLLVVRDLRCEFRSEGSIVRAVDGVSFTLAPGETLGVVGESGSGKSVTMLALLGLIPMPPGRIASGEAIFEGRDLLRLSPSELRRVRGNRISMIFQDPMTSLNPYLRISQQLEEVLAIHRKAPARARRERAVEMLAHVGLPDPAKRIQQYPHQLSGGMRQRVMIAMALLCEPALLIADEPTTALDVTIQAQILRLFGRLKRSHDTAILFITHDLGVVAGITDRVMVMYAGRPVERARTIELFRAPSHPYTIGLLRSVPRVDREAPAVASPPADSLDGPANSLDGPGGVGHDSALPGGASPTRAAARETHTVGPAARLRLIPIPGLPPDVSRPIPGCAFAPRCPFVEARCVREAPPLVTIAPGHETACWRAAEVRAMPAAERDAWAARKALDLASR